MEKVAGKDDPDAVKDMQAFIDAFSPVLAEAHKFLVGTHAHMQQESLPRPNTYSDSLGLVHASNTCICAAHAQSLCLQAPASRCMEACPPRHVH